jgi:6-phosphogluconate dehydrogenase
VFREKKEHMVIPVPEAESNITYYDRLYKGELKVPKQLMHIQREYQHDLFPGCHGTTPGVM